jgi:hypothetical protein
MERMARIASELRDGVKEPAAPKVTKTPGAKKGAIDVFRTCVNVGHLLSLKSEPDAVNR